MNEIQRSRLGRRRESRRGATVVEFAITAPLFFLFLLAAFEFGWFNVMRHTADNAAYEAARHAMVPGATAAEARERANSILSIVGTRDADVRVTPSVVTPQTDEITVTINVPLNSNSLILPRFTRNSTLQATSTLRTERADQISDDGGGGGVGGGDDDDDDDRGRGRGRRGGRGRR